MQLKTIGRIQGKELTLFFASPIGYLFLGAFLAVTLFVFFWGESFFARNIADVRPMFEWLPILLIFLSAALTMRMWSEERRSGTLEFVATLPATIWSFVVGKFLACWTLLGIALLLTLPLPLTVSFIGDLDWGPVIAGYIAAMLLGGMYIAVGLFVSARSDSQIVSLLLSTLVCGVFYLVGSPLITALFGAGIQELLSAIGSGARFEAITRGVLDFRDLYFYVSIALVFLTGNVYALESEHWAQQSSSTRHRDWRWGTGLLVANLLAANVWLQPVNVLRVDMTQGDIYSISTATEGYLSQLKEPLLIRGYFSEKTHPLLSPLVPRMKDLLQEYAVVGGKNVRVEIVDPADSPELEDEANNKYAIRAVPFQVADRYQASLVNSYFDVLIAYGDEYEVLSFQDLIEVKVVGEADLDVQLSNPEFDVTRSIKKVLFGFQGGSSVFDNIFSPVEFVGYISADTVLPSALIELKPALTQALQALAREGGDKFSFTLIDPEAGDGQLARDINAQYGFQPMAASLFDDSRFYFYLTLNDGQTLVQVPIPEALSAENFQRAIEEGLKRYASGLLKTVVLHAPAPVSPYLAQQGAPPSQQFTQLQGFLSDDFEVTIDQLENGQVPANADLVIVVDPDGLDERQVFALDQFLMRGGTVVVSSGAFAVQTSQSGINAVPRNSGLEPWLAHHGVSIESALVMDPQNAAFPVPVTRQAGGFSFQELVMLDYPYFIDVRAPGLHAELPITTGLSQITMSWASPLTVQPAENILITPILSSSLNSWRSSQTNVMPRIDEQGLSAFVPADDTARQTLGVALQGRFESYFANQASVLLNSPTTNKSDPQDGNANSSAMDKTPNAAELGVISSVIDRSPESARLLVFSSNDFLADQTLAMVGSADGTAYSNSLQLVANIVDWALEDQNLIDIRSRGNFNRTLPGLSKNEQTFIEILNYLLALAGLALVYGLSRSSMNRKAALHRSWLEVSTGEQA